MQKFASMLTEKQDVVQIDEVDMFSKRALDGDKNVQILDARSPSRFLGLEPEPRRILNSRSEIRQYPRKH